MVKKTDTAVGCGFPIFFWKLGTYQDLSKSIYVVYIYIYMYSIYIYIYIQYISKIYQYLSKPYDVGILVIYPKP